MEFNVQNGCFEMERERERESVCVYIYIYIYTTTRFTSYENEPHLFSLTQHKFMLIQRDGVHKDL